MRRCRLRISPYNQGSIRHLFIVAYRPLSFHREVRGNMFTGQLILLPSLGVKQSTLLFKLISTRYGLKFIPKEIFVAMFITKSIICNNISSPTIPTFGFATIHNFLVF